MTEFFIRNIWLVILLPALGTVFLHFFGRRIGEPLAGWIASTTIGGSFLIGLIAAIPLFQGNAEAHVVRLFDWIPALGATAELLWDPLAALMVLIVAGVGAVIHVYAIGYMHGDDRYARFFVYLNLFATSMLTLVLANNFAILFVGWELVGLCSYLLISFWYVRPSAAAAGKKAFIVNRIGDFGFLIGLMVIFATFGTLSYTTVLDDPGKLLGAGAATAVGLLLLVGATGKSAQLPLYVWLPDAMEGPTPVSALIHAATMVTAGVFMIARTSAIYALSDTASIVVATIGALTAFFAATIAMAQTDIKRVLAYSTISQLGYMFLGVGSAAYVAGVFHLMTHAFFKALLFLGAGAVIHGMSEEQNIFKMGGLWSKMKTTGFTMAIATLAISGIPPFAGFWSKDEILGTAFNRGGWWIVLWAIGLITAGITAFYMTRWFVLTFLGEPRWDEGVHPHEAPKVMTIPLMVLAVLATVGGLINTPFRAGLEHFLEPSFEGIKLAGEPGGLLLWLLAALSVLVALAGMVIAWRLYTRPDGAEESWTTNIPSLWRRMGNAYYMDDVYGTLVVAPGKLASAWSAFVLDQKFIDGAVNGIGNVVRRIGAALRPLQSGYVRNYALTIAAGVVGFVIWFLSTGGL
ncbi:MAG: NADH-quinone oxidoreductase subunit L [Actinobacteria bacterium]|nr:NADH-quinone oxidoreductase subunit L [Actinomycetota bacterium]